MLSKFKIDSSIGCLSSRKSNPLIHIVNAQQLQNKYTTTLKLVVKEEQKKGKKKVSCFQGICIKCQRSFGEKQEIQS